MRRRAVRPPSQILTRATDHVAVAVGTTVGLFLVSDGEADGPWFKGSRIESFLQVGNVYVVATSDQGVSSIHLSADGGSNWEPMTSPTSPATPDGLSVLQLTLDARQPPFELAPLLVGVAPAALFLSRDLCRSFDLIEAFDSGNPQNGVHTVLTHAARPRRLIVGTFDAVYRSDDGGTSWATVQAGLPRHSSEEPSAPARIHKLAMDAERPDLLWLQARDGTYRSANAGESWEEVGWPTQTAGLPSSFGLSLLAHPDEPDTAFVFPLESPCFPCAAEARARVYRTSDGAKTWEPLTAGLPLGRAYLEVPREAFAAGSAPPFPFVFGTSTGQLYASADGGDHWRLFADNLPPVLCTRVLA